ERRAGGALALDLVEDAEIAQADIDEARYGPQRVDDRGAGRVQVEQVDVHLPVEHVGEIDVPVDELAAAGGDEVVVVAEEPGLAVVGDIEIVAAVRPQDVVLHLDVARAAVDADVVAGGRVEGVVDDVDVADAADQHC